MTLNVILHLNPSLNEAQSITSENETDISTYTINYNTASPPSSPSPLPPQCQNVKSLTVHVHDPINYDPLSLSTLTPFLCNDGSAVVKLCSHTSSDDNKKKIINSIKLAGLSIESELSTKNNAENGGIEFEFVARWKKINSSASLQVKSRPLAFAKKIRTPKEEEKKETEPTTNNKTAAIKLNSKLFADDLDGGGDEEFIDEDDLLELESTRTELAPPPSVDPSSRSENKDDCGGRKACDDCTCGRAEREAAEEGNVNNTGKELPPKSACGNCAKGDAFRCAGCPYLGKPAFKEGEEHLVLDLMDDL